MDTESFITHVKINDTFKEEEDDVETRFDTSNFELYRPLGKNKGKNKKVFGLMKDELVEKIMKEFVGLIAKKACSYLTDNINKAQKQRLKVRKCQKKENYT